MMTQSTVSETTTSLLAREIYFTQIHQENCNAPAWERESACLRAQFPAALAPIHPEDDFAGRESPMLVGVSPEPGGLGYYCQAKEIRAIANRPQAKKITRQQADWLLDYWAGRTTQEHCRAAFPPHLAQGLPDDDYINGAQISFPLYRLAGPYLNYDKLMQLGITGLRGTLQECKAQIDPGFFCTLSLSLDLFCEVAHWYAQQARDMAASYSANCKRLLNLAECLEHIAVDPPQTFQQAIQLAWLYSLMAQVLNYGRMDVYLGDFLAHDLDSGLLSMDEALGLTESLWKLINIRGNVFNNRIVIGGLGRRNPSNADRFVFVALETQRRVHDILPQLTLRWHTGMDAHIWQKALDVIGMGNPYPMLYNDDVNVPGVARAFNVSSDEAEQYLPFGCGEYVLDHRSIGTPNGTINLLKALDVTLHNGVDPFNGEPCGLALGGLSDFTTFEDLQNAYACQVEHQVDLLAEAEQLIYRATGEELIFPFISLLYDDCLVRSRAVLQGGVRYLGGTLETYGNNSTADALLAIQQAVYERKWLSSDRLLAALDANWQGNEIMRCRLKTLPKFGNDDPTADAMSLWVNTQVCTAVRNQHNRTGLHSYLAVLINNNMNVGFGQKTAASAEGRRRGDSLSNGNQPGVGHDANGPTAVLNSMAKLDPGLHAGAVHNIKLARSMFRSHRAALEALLFGYFVNGGTQLMLTVTDRNELERAMQFPDQYAHLLVRVGGYSERFVNLPRAIQLEILERTLYE
jgi:pyruvate-formate lyase